MPLSEMASGCRYNAVQFSNADLTPTLESTFSLGALEAKLVSYMGDASASAVPFDFASIPKVSKEQSLENALRTCPLVSPLTPPF